MASKLKFFWIWKVNSQKPLVMYFGRDILTLSRHKFISKYRIIQILLVLPTLKADMKKFETFRGRNYRNVEISAAIEFYIFALCHNLWSKIPILKVLMIYF